MCLYIFSAAFCTAHCALDLARDHAPQKCPLVLLIFKQPKRIKMVALMLLLPTEAEEKMNTCTDQNYPTYHQRPQIFQENLDSYIKTHYNRHRQR